MGGESEEATGRAKKPLGAAIVGSGWSLHGENNRTQSLRDALLFPALLTLNR